MITMGGRRPLSVFFFLIGTVALLCAGLLFLRNYREDKYAAEQSMRVLEQLYAEHIKPEIPHGQFTEPEKSIPDYVLDPDMEMPTTEIDGNRYVGYLQFPALDIELPVMSSWSYSGPRTAPGLYAGTIYKGNAVIAAHNYTCHFGRLSQLRPGDPVCFVDVDGNRFLYEVTLQEVLEPTAIEEMTASGFELSLFTCTYGGESRLTIRCSRIPDDV